MKLQQFIFNPFHVNTFVLYDETGECVIIDAACYFPEEFSVLNDFIKSHSLNPVFLLNTHGHVDHLTGSARVCKEYNIGVRMHENDKFFLDYAMDQGKMFGIEISPPPIPELWILDGEEIFFGNSSLIAWHTPGHSPGSIIFYNSAEAILIAGDVLFEGSIGRTDLPGGNYNQLIKSIESKILILSENTVVFPGHGSSTTIKNEIKFNPFLKKSF